MILIDTSSWIEALRINGQTNVRDRVNFHIQSGEACWCHPVRLELWNGSKGAAENARLRAFEEVLEVLPIDDGVWERTLDLARKARGSGLNLPAMDLLIAACGFHHGVQIESVDKHFPLLEKWR